MASLSLIDKHVSPNVISFTAAGSAKQKNSQATPDELMPRPTKTLNLYENRASIPVRIGTREMIAKGNVPMPGVPAVYIDEGIA